MSAVFGILRFDGDSVRQADLERMSNTLAHRGGDARKFIVDGQTGLGHRLKRVTHEDAFEAQPLHDRVSGIILVADLRLDNREELAGSLDIAVQQLSEVPDSAFVLAAYKKWGRECASHLLGDFAFAIWDPRLGELLLGRDHMGQRPLFYHHGAHFFAFATEIKALWSIADVPRTLNEDELGRFLLLMPDRRPPGETLYVGVSSLIGGSTLTLNRRGTSRLDRYWQPHADPMHENRSESYYLENYRRILEEAVVCRVRRLVRPPALLLSAGFDSAAIAGLAGATLRAQNRKLLGYSIVVPDAYRDTKFDIRPRVEQCKRIMPHLDARYVQWREESPLIGIEKHYFLADGPVPPNHDVLRRVYADAKKEGASVIMDGIGGDYTINPRGKEALAWLLRNGQLRRFIAEFLARLHHTGTPLWSTLLHDVIYLLLPPRLAQAIRRLRRGHEVDPKDVVLNRSFLHALFQKGAIGNIRRNAAIPAVQMRRRTAEGARRVALSSGAGGGIAAAHGLEFTRPFHDKRVVEFGLAIPEVLYTKQGRNRYLARQALADVYPPEFLTRGPENEAMTPNIPAEVEPIMPMMMAEATRMESNERLMAFLDMDLAKRLLSLPTTKLDHVARAKQMMAYRAVMMGRFIDWFEGRNTK
jgi:asparagine synthase (glutamine-hydrolysing)